MNTEKIKFYKKHPVLLAWLISIFIGLGYALFTIIASVIHYEQRDYVWEIITAFTEMFTWAILMGAVLVFPVVLTISEGICLISEAWERPVKGAWLFDQHVFWLGGFYELCYLGLIMDVTSADWQTQLSNSNKHTPIYSGSMVTFIVLILLAFIGYEILQSIPLWKLPPLVTVLSISAMYMGLLELILFTVQIFKPTILLDGYLLLFPLCCVLLVVRLLLKKIREWNAPDTGLHLPTGTTDCNPSPCRLSPPRPGYRKCAALSCHHHNGQTCSGSAVLISPPAVLCPCPPHRRQIHPHRSGLLTPRGKYY